MVTKCIKFLVIRAIEVTAIILLIVYLPNLPPHAKFSESYRVTTALPFEGKLALNERLNSAEIVFKGELHGPEAFAVYNGELYTTLNGGDVVKIVGNKIIPIVKFGKPCKGIYQEQICGRPLGLSFDKNGALYVVDAYYGIFKVNVKTGKYEQLISVNEEIANKKPKIPNSLAIASNGDFYWTDSSSDFALYDGLYEILSDGSGRLIYYDAKTKKNKVLLENIHFANGILLSKDESFLIVAETARNRILRYYLKGPKKGTSDVFLDGLPGSPDNLQFDGQSGFFVPLVMTADGNNPQFFQSLSQFPLIRKFLARLLGVTELVFKFVDQIYPNEWAEKSVHFIGSFHSAWNILPIPKRLTILHVSESGQIIDSFHALDGKITAISDAIVFNDVLYLGSPKNDFLVKVSLSKAGLKHLANAKPDVPKVTPTPAPTKVPTTTPPPPKTTPPPQKTTTAPSQKVTTPPPQTTTTSPPPPKTQSPPSQKETPPPAKATVPPTATEAPKPSTEKVKTSSLPPTKAEPTTKAPPTAKTTSETPTTKTSTATKADVPSAANVPKEKPTATTPPNKATTEKVKVENKESETTANKETKGKK